MANRVPRKPFVHHGRGLAIQRLALQQRHPWLRVTTSGSVLTAEGKCQPTPLTAEYGVRIRYALGFDPIAEVLNPKPQRRNPDHRVIHTNGRDDVPCLFLPGEREWHADLLLANTVVPWLLEWLAFYEAWHVTGNWVAGGVLPPDYGKGTSK